MTAEAAPLPDLPEERDGCSRCSEQADSVELKLTVSEPHQRSTVIALALDPLEAQATAGLLLRHAGPRARPARRRRARPAVAGQGRRLGGEAAARRAGRAAEGECGDPRASASRWTPHPTGFVCSGSLKGTPRRGNVWDAAAGKKRIRKLFSKEQRALYEAHAPEGLALDDLAVLGPILVLKLKRTPKGFGRPLVAEVWVYPDGSRILELSTKCQPIGGVPGRGRGAGVSRLARRRAPRRAGDEDADGARVLLGPARGDAAR